jgi:hypothetical protein
MYPHLFSKLDPDLHSPKKPDSHKVNADPKHCPSDRIAGRFFDLTLTSEVKKGEKK